MAVPSTMMVEVAAAAGTGRHEANGDGLNAMHHALLCSSGRRMGRENGKGQGDGWASKEGCLSSCGQEGKDRSAQGRMGG